MRPKRFWGLNLFSSLLLFYSSILNSPPSTSTPRSSTLLHPPLLLDPQPSSIHLYSSILNSPPSTSTPRSSTLLHPPLLLDPQLSSIHLYSSILNSPPSTSTPRSSTLLHPPLLLDPQPSSIHSTPCTPRSSRRAPKSPHASSVGPEGVGARRRTDLFDAHSRRDQPKTTSRGAGGPSDRRRCLPARSDRHLLRRERRSPATAPASVGAAYRGGCERPTT